MSTRLYVGNLSFNSNKDSLREAFTATGGEVTDVHIVTDRESGQSRGFFRLAAPLLERMVRRSITNDLETLKEYLEANASP